MGGGRWERNGRISEYSNIQANSWKLYKVVLKIL